MSRLTVGVGVGLGTVAVVAVLGVDLASKLNN